MNDTNNILHESQNVQLFHSFILILPCINYSNDKIDQNIELFSPLFEIDSNSQYNSTSDSNSSSPSKSDTIGTTPAAKKQSLKILL